MSKNNRGGRRRKQSTQNRPAAPHKQRPQTRRSSAAPDELNSFFLTSPSPEPDLAPPDNGIEELRSIQHEFQDFLTRVDAPSEADTRVKLIDRILVDVCGWPEAAIRRERHVHAGFLDYELLLNDRPYVAVEAKREGSAFVFPADSRHRAFKLSGAILTKPDVRDAIQQVRQYCDDAGIRYSVATNGNAWIIFRAIREDMPWRDGTARVFPDLDFIAEHFTDFWNLLSKPAVAGGRLDREFGALHRPPRELHRVIDRLFNADLPLQRNRLHAQLYPVIKTIFEDIADQAQVEILQRCYVHSASLKIVAKDIDTVITDSIPAFLRHQGAEPVLQSDTDAGRFGLTLEKSIDTTRGQLILLLGGIGSGKTTFLKRYQRTVGAELLSNQTIWFHIDFLSAPLDPLEMEPYVWKTILDQLRNRYTTPHLETRRNIKRVFSHEIEAISETALKHLHPSSEQFDAALSPYLEKWQKDINTYVPRLLGLCKPRQNTRVVLFVDNVDQLAPEYQAQIFLLAQRVTRVVNSTTVVALREESYYTADIQNAFTAYTSRKFHIASPHFRRLIGSRIEYAINVLDDASSSDETFFSGGVAFDRDSIRDFLKIVDYSIFEHNKNIARFIEAICFGNMRFALQMFTTFLTSGATDVDKMLAIYRRDGSYYVAFHEFVKSIMLGDRAYYRERPSVIMNVFDCGAERNSSHFTALRALALLLAHRGETTRQGQGYVETSRVISVLEDVFDNREDIIRTLDRLVYRQLVETITRSTTTIENASHIRATSAGWYYSRHLVREFSYLDLILQDTPFDDVDVERTLRDSVFKVGNIGGGRDDEKIARMDARFDRVERFLGYLAREEDAEHKRFGLEQMDSIIADPIVPRIYEAYTAERGWIRKRLIENRERYADEASALALAEELPSELAPEYDSEDEITPE